MKYNPIFGLGYNNVSTARALKGEVDNYFSWINFKLEVNICFHWINFKLEVNMF